MICVVPPVGAVPLRDALLYVGRGVTELRGAKLPIRSALRAAFAIGYVQEQVRRRGASPCSSRFLIEVCRGANTYIAYWLANRGWKVAVAPQNVESLVPNPRLTRRDEVMQYQMERGIYEHAHCTLCISDVDAYIVRCMGATAATVPYFPGPKDIVRFNEVRNSRRHAAEAFKLLYVGTVHNQPTLAGLKNLSERFSASFPEPWTLHVVGYGTEVACEMSHARILVEGAVSDARLNTLLTECAAILLSQPATTGFLTRLVEMNLCGIPSFVNEEYLPAAGLERFGIYTYQDLNDVGRMISESGAKKFEEFRPISKNEEARLRNFIWNA